jgi:hypothetical protein
MSNRWTYPDVSGMNRRREEGATTSANVGVYEKPLGGMIRRTPDPLAPGNSDSFPTPQGQYFDAEEYLRKLGLR